MNKWTNRAIYSLFFWVGAAETLDNGHNKLRSIPLNIGTVSYYNYSTKAYRLCKYDDCRWATSME